MKSIGNDALERVRTSIRSTIAWMDNYYMYAGPNGAQITNYEDLEKAMSPEDWQVYCFLSKLSCKLV